MANNEYVNKVLFGDTTVMDISDTTAEEGDVIEGQTFYTRSGAPATGSLGDATTSAHGLMSANDKIKLDSLSTVATSGDYDDLSNKPDLSGYITSVPTMTGATSNTDGTAGLIPAPTTADAEKFFRGDGTWQDGGRPMVILSYGSSTWQDFMDAYTHNVIVYCRASSNSNPASGQQLRMAFMAYVAGNASNPTEVEFQYYRSVNSHSLTQQGDQVFVYKLNNKGIWSVIVRQASSKIVAGNNMSVTYSSADTLTVASMLESKAAAASGTDVSLVTTGEKAIWNNKADIEDIPTATSDLTNDSGYLIMSDLINKADLDANGKVLSTQLPDSLDKNQGTENAGKFMKVGSDGNLVPDNVPDPISKADKVSNATNGNFAGLDADGNLTDSGNKASDFMTRSAVVDLVYPVGSIYMSVTSTSPATLFGGTWQQLKDRFLLGTGDTYKNGATGGAASVSYTPAGTNSGGAVGNHTLTVNEIPSHNHSFTGSAVNTGNQSAGHTHNITDYYATTTGASSLTEAQLASHDHVHPISHGDGTVISSTEALHINGAALQLAVFSNLRLRYRSKKAGSGNTHTHSGANTSTTRTSTGISANHTHSVTASGSIGNKGGGGAHNHGFTQPTFTGTKATINTMPPYLVVYMWKRTA